MKNKILTLSLLLASGTLYAQGDWGLGGNNIVGTSDKNIIVSPDDQQGFIAVLTNAAMPKNMVGSY